MDYNNFENFSENNFDFYDEYEQPKKKKRRKKKKNNQVGLIILLAFSTIITLSLCIFLLLPSLLQGFCSFGCYKKLKEKYIRTRL